MGSNYSLKYDVDIVMCIDATGSMTGILDTVKKNALNFYGDVRKAMQEKGKQVDTMRIKDIAFRDYLADGNKAMLATDFYTMPEEQTEFNNLVKSIHAEGGGDDPEDGLEALAYAIKSDWGSSAGNKRRHIIVVWTDAATHELGFGKAAPMYPSQMAATFDQLTNWWEEMDSNSKRLLIYAPEEKYWTTISDTWTQTIHYPSQAGNGLKEFEYQEILDAIRNSIC